MSTSHPRVPLSIWKHGSLPRPDAASLPSIACLSSTVSPNAGHSGGPAPTLNLEEAAGSRKVKLIKHAQQGPNVETPRYIVKAQGPGGPQAWSPMLTNKPVDGITNSADMSLNV